MRVTRVGYGAPGGDAIHPLDAELMPPARVWSYVCQRRFVRAVIFGPFDEAITWWPRSLGRRFPSARPSRSSPMRRVDFDSFYAARAA